MEREWYAVQAVKEAWSRTTLEMHIKSKLHLRLGSAINNFKQHLAEQQANLANLANLANQILKDPYHFDFLGLSDEAHEQDIESALIRHITRFLLELGAGFAEYELVRALPTPLDVNLPSIEELEMALSVELTEEKV